MGGGEWRVNSRLLASMLLLGNFLLHMTAMSDSRPPFRTKKESWARGRSEEQRAAQR